MKDPLEIEIVPTRGWRALNLAEVWEFRELLRIFVWRDLKVRYRQTLLGVAWVGIQPLLTMLIFTVLMNRVARLDADPSIPYSLFVMAGLVPWNFFSAAVSAAGNSMLGSGNLVSKVYFPRLIIPSSSVVACAVDAAIVAVILLALMMFYGIPPGAAVAIVPLVALAIAAFALGAGYWLAALNVEYRDVRVIVPFALQFWMYATPVVYPLHLLPQPYQRFAVLNPMTGLVEAFRSAILGRPILLMPLVWGVFASLVLLVSGAFYFRRVEREFADRL